MATAENKKGSELLRSDTNQPRFEKATHRPLVCIPAILSPWSHLVLSSLHRRLPLHAQFCGFGLPRGRVVEGEGDVVLLALVERVRGQLNRLPLRAVLELESQRIFGVERLACLLLWRKTRQSCKVQTDDVSEDD